MCKLPYAGIEPSPQIGTKIGIWEIFNGQIGSVLEINNDKRGENLDTDVLNPIPLVLQDLLNEDRRLPGMSRNYRLE